MVQRTCASCGAVVGTLASWCPRCGSDPDVRLIELGAGVGRHPAPGDGGRGSGGRRRRWWVPLAAGVVGIWALLALTASGAEDREADAAAGTTTTEPDRTTTTRHRPRAVTTTTAQQIPGAPLLGELTGLQLVAVTDRSRIIDVDTGLVQRMPTGHVLGAAGAGLLVVGEEGVSLWPAPFDGSGATLLLEATSAQQAWVVGGGTMVWVLEPSDRGEPTATLVDLAGRVLLDVTLPPMAWPVGAVDSGLVVSAAGGTYIVDNDGDIDRLSIGDVVAVGANRIFVTNCDETLHCAFEVLDGRGQRVGTVEEAGQYYGYVVAAAPDGRVAYTVGDGDSMAVAIDGEVVADVGYGGPGALAWSPDGRWLALAAVNGVHFIDTTGGHETVVVEVGSGEPAWQLFLLPST